MSSIRLFRIAHTMSLVNFSDETYRGRIFPLWNVLISLPIIWIRWVFPKPTPPYTKKGLYFVPGSCTIAGAAVYASSFDAPTTNVAAEYLGFKLVSGSTLKPRSIWFPNVRTSALVIFLSVESTTDVLWSTTNSSFLAESSNPRIIPRRTFWYLFSTHSFAKLLLTPTKNTPSFLSTNLLPLSHVAKFALESCTSISPRVNCQSCSRSIRTIVAFFPRESKRQKIKTCGLPVDKFIKLRNTKLYESTKFRIFVPFRIS